MDSRVPKKCKNNLDFSIIFNTFVYKRFINNLKLKVMKKNPIIWTDELIREAIDLYINYKYSITQIAKKLQCCSATVSKTLKKNNITIVNRQNEIKFDINEAIKDYKNGMTLEHVCSKYHTSYYFMKKVLNAANIKIINPITKVKFNENVFDSIDTEEKAYWLGFIFADGCISNEHSFELSLAEKDYAHLIKFNQFMKHEDPNHVKINKASYNKIRCRWSIRNKHLYKILDLYGCTPRKSLTLEFPKLEIFKDESLIRHFIRGYFDGDGCISRQIYSKTVSPSISLLGTPEFFNTLSIILKEYGILSKVKQEKKHSEKTKTLYFDVYNGVLFINYIYNNSNIYLDRKYQLYQFFKNGCRSKKEFLELLESKNGRDWDVNPVVTEETKASSAPYSVETEPENQNKMFPRVDSI